MRQSPAMLPTYETVSSDRLVTLLERLCDEHARRGTGGKPFVAFDADGTLWSGDIGCDVFDAQIKQGYFTEAVRSLFEREMAALGLRRGGFGIDECQLGAPLSERGEVFGAVDGALSNNVGQSDRALSFPVEPAVCGELIAHITAHKVTPNCSRNFAPSPITRALSSALNSASITTGAGVAGIPAD